MAFIHQHTKEEWLIGLTTKLISNNEGFIVVISKDNRVIAKIPIGGNGLNNMDREHSDVKLIRSAPKLLEFAEMLYDFWRNQSVEPMLFKELENTIINAGVEITDKKK